MGREEEWGRRAILESLGKGGGAEVGGRRVPPRETSRESLPPPPGGVLPEARLPKRLGEDPGAPSPNWGPKPEEEGGRVLR